jgi:hypothetical protein
MGFKGLTTIPDVFAGHFGVHRFRTISLEFLKNAIYIKKRA